MVIGKGIVRTSQPVRSTVAGCTFADIMMFLVMKVVDKKVREAAPPAHSAVVADDYQILVCRPREQAMRITLAAHNATRSVFAAMRLPVSEKKQILMASDELVAKEVAAADATLKKSRRRTARNLGVDFTLGRRRYTAVFAARAFKTRKKIIKLKIVRSRYRHVTLRGLTGKFESHLWLRLHWRFSIPANSLHQSSPQGGHKEPDRTVSQL